MTIQADETNNLPEPLRGNQGDRAGETPHSLACLTTFAPSAMLFHQLLYGQLSTLGERVHEVEMRVEHLNTIVERQFRQCDEHVAALTACQRDTAQVLNHELERQALHPAVEAVVALAEELSRLGDCASQLRDTSGDRDGVDRLRTEINVSCSVGREKLANLDVQRITPAEGDQLDPKVHTVCGCVVTIDENLHGRISQLVTPGITYRGKVLRQARVIVFRTETHGNQP